jgi:hypothetical protein
MPRESSSRRGSESPANANKRPLSNALELGPRKRPYVDLSVIPSSISLLLRTAQDPLVHHGRHFGRVVHAFCSVQTLITNGIAMLAEQENGDMESITVQ